MKKADLPSEKKITSISVNVSRKYQKFYCLLFVLFTVSVTNITMVSNARSKIFRNVMLIFTTSFYYFQR